MKTKEALAKEHASQIETDLLRTVIEKAFIAGWNIRQGEFLDIQSRYEEELKKVKNEK